MIKVDDNITIGRYSVGVIVARFQVDELHEGHKALIDTVYKNHTNIIIFLGVSRIQNTKTNPLDFATRKAMVQEYLPSAIILPQLDNRSDQIWSDNLDKSIHLSLGDVKALLYGSRDSFIPHYLGKHNTTELTPHDAIISGTTVRQRIGEKIIHSKEFRAGIIYSTQTQRPSTYPTVDIAPYNDNGQILLARKQGENKFRLIGGFVDRRDSSYESAAIREFNEETGGGLKYINVEYVTSILINDWRYYKTESGIMTTLYKLEIVGGTETPTDDIIELKWFNINEFNNMTFIRENVMEEHIGLITILYSDLTKDNRIIKI